MERKLYLIEFEESLGAMLSARTYGGKETQLCSAEPKADVEDMR
jgi:hypothetical protein